MTSVRKRFRGVVVPMVTPFTAGEALDEPAVARILDHVLESGVRAVLLLGTTGEGASMDPAARRRLIEIAVGHLEGRATTFANVSSDSLATSIDEACAFREIGVDAVVAHLPVYYPLEPARMRRWFERLADDAPAPLFLYNIPMTTGMSIPVETAIALSGHHNVAGMKDSENDLDRMETLLSRLGDRADFAYFVGPSAHALHGLSRGAAGFVPGVGNLLPEVCQRLMEGVERGDRPTAIRMQERMKRVGDIYQANRTVSQAIPLIKAGMSALGLCGPTVLPPLAGSDEADREAMVAVLNELASRAPSRT
ncbi:MAG: dihydrodipicolinate synthase family protein [Gemmatimonadota bacterium]